VCESVVRDIAVAMLGLQNSESHQMILGPECQDRCRFEKKRIAFDPLGVQYF
jgi:hypothetical protein